MNERNEPEQVPEEPSAPTGDQAVTPGPDAGTDAPKSAPKAKSSDSQGSTQKATPPEGAVDQKKRRRRRRRPPQEAGLERISQVHYCRTDAEANQYLALGPEWDLQDIIPMRVETEDGGERDEVHFVVARWENERDRARLRKRDRRGVPRRPRE